MRQISDQQYSQFTPKERVQLVFAALARNDEAEATRLWETCPRHAFVTADLNFTEQVTAVNLITAMFFEKCMKHYNCIKRADQFISGLENDLEYEESEKLLDAASQTKKNIEHVERAWRGHLSHLKALFKGFEQFCDGVGLNYADLIKMLPIEESCWDIEYLLSLEDETYEQAATEFYKMLISCWRF